MIDEANKTFEKCGYEIQLRDNAVKPFSAPTLMDVHITDWSTVNCASQPTRTGDEAALLDDGSRRSAVTTDINVYFVRSFLVGNGLPPDKTLAETIAQDCFSGMPIGDSANSGIIVWSEKVRGNFKRFMRILGHELGHAMLVRGDWGDEHKNFFGQAYAAPFVMKHDVDEKSVQFDLNECTSMNKDLTIFQGDP